MSRPHHGSFWGDGRPEERYRGSLPYYYYSGGFGVREDPFWGPSTVLSYPGYVHPRPPPPHHPRNNRRRRNNNPIFVSVNKYGTEYLMAAGAVCLGLLVGGIVVAAVASNSSGPSSSSVKVPKSPDYL